MVMLPCWAAGQPQGCRHVRGKHTRPCRAHRHLHILQQNKIKLMKKEWTGPEVTARKKKSTPFLGSREMRQECAYLQVICHLCAGVKTRAGTVEGGAFSPNISLSSRKKLSLRVPKAHCSLWSQTQVGSPLVPCPLLRGGPSGLLPSPPRLVPSGFSSVSSQILSCKSVFDALKAKGCFINLHQVTLDPALGAY